MLQMSDKSLSIHDVHGGVTLHLDVLLHCLAGQCVMFASSQLQYRPVYFDRESLHFVLFFFPKALLLRASQHPPCA